jgi:hypothetical protein
MTWLLPLLVTQAPATGDTGAEPPPAPAAVTEPPLEPEGAVALAGEAGGCRCDTGASPTRAWLALLWRRR